MTSAAPPSRARYSQTSPPPTQFFSYKSTKHRIKLAYRLLLPPSVSPDTYSPSSSPFLPFPLVMINGRTRVKEDWFSYPYDLFHSLSSFVPLLLFDNRGLGESEYLDPRGFSETEYHIEDLVEDVKWLLGHVFPRCGQFHFLGASFGGTIAMSTALTYPSLCKSLLICGSSWTGKELASPGAPKFGPNYMYELSLYWAKRMVTPKWLSEHKSDFDAMFGVEMTRKRPDIVVYYQVECSRKFLLTEDMGKSLSETCPVVVIHGREDVVCTPEEGEELHRRIPKSSIKWLDLGGHNFWTVEPQKSVEFVTEWMNAFKS